MSNDVIIPDLEGGPAAIFKEQNIQTERLGAGDDGVGFGMVGPNGKEFYVSYKGKKVTLVNPPTGSETDGLPAQYFDFVILRQAERKSHTYYVGGYKQGSNDRPTCASTDGIAPDDNVLKKQADLCQLCPQHEWKRQPNGRDGRACTDSLRLAVFPMPGLIQHALGAPIVEPILFRIMAASLRGFSDFGDAMEAKFGGNAPFCSYVMRATFKKGVEWPQYEYRVVRWLKPHEAKSILEMREDPLAYRILGLTPEGRSLTRRETLVNISGQVAREPVDAIPFDQGAVAQRLAEERQARIAAVRQPQTIEATAEEIVIPSKQESPKQEHKQEAKASPQQVADTTPDLDELVRRMRPQPPQS